MQMASWLADLDEVLSEGTVDESSTLITLHRVPGTPIESDGAWDARPVVAIERDQEDIDLITYNTALTPMTVADLRAWFSEHPDCGDCELFVPEPWEQADEDLSLRHDVPAVAMVVNARMSHFGVLVWYEGCESELG